MMLLVSLAKYSGIRNLAPLVLLHCIIPIMSFSSSLLAAEDKVDLPANSEAPALYFVNR